MHIFLVSVFFWGHPVVHDFLLFFFSILFFLEESVPEMRTTSHVKQSCISDTKLELEQGCIEISRTPDKSLWEGAQKPAKTRAFLTCF